MPLTEITYDADYFQGAQSQAPEPSGYSDYAEPNYRDTNTRVNQLVLKFQAAGIDPVGKKVLVLGCAYGYLVKYLVSIGADAYGMDVSAYAISQAPQEIASRLFVGSAVIEANYQTAKTMAGLSKRNDVFDLIVDEDMIPCLTDAQAITMCTLAKKYGNMVYHLIDTSPHLSNWYNFHTPAEWRVLVGQDPKEKWYSIFTWGDV